MKNALIKSSKNQPPKQFYTTTRDSPNYSWFDRLVIAITKLARVFRKKEKRTIQYKREHTADGSTKVEFIYKKEC